MLAENLDCARNLLVLRVAVAINEEKYSHALRLLGRDSIFVRFILNLRNAAMASCSAPTLSETLTSNSCVVTRRRAACAAEHEKRVAFAHCPGCPAPARAACIFQTQGFPRWPPCSFLRRQLRRTRVGRRFNNFHARQMVLNPAAHCASDCGCTNSFLICARGELLIRHCCTFKQSANDLQIAVHEHVERVRDDAFRGIFHRHHAVIRAVLGDLGEKRPRWFFCDP